MFAEVLDYGVKWTIGACPLNLKKYDTLLKIQERWMVFSKREKKKTHKVTNNTQTN